MNSAPDHFKAVCEHARLISLDENARTVRHVISTARLDRANRMVEPSGWKLSTFRDNPVVLANHEYSLENIIGRAIDTKVDGDALVSTTQFEKDGLGNIAFRLVQSGTARAWSVGWRGMQGHRIGEQESCSRCEAAGKVDYGYHFTKQELLEYSLVAIPANPDAVMGLQAAGLASRDEIDSWLGLCASEHKSETATEMQGADSSARSVVAIPSALFQRELRRVSHSEALRSTRLRLAQQRRG